MFSKKKSEQGTKANSGLTRRSFILGGAATVGLASLGFMNFVILGKPELNQTFDDIEPPPKGSHVVAVAAALLQRELDRGWRPSAFWRPWQRFEINQKHFQIGVLKGCEGTVMVLRDQIARLRGTSEMDADLVDAYRRVSYPADQWGVWKANSTVRQIQTGIDSLQRYNDRLAQGKATYDRRGDSLGAYLDRDINDLGSFEDRLSTLADQKGLLSMEAQAVYYEGRGLLHANYHLFKAMRKDFSELLHLFAIENVFDKALRVMHDVSSEWGAPRAVINDSPGDSFASHVETLSGGMTRVRTALYEVRDSSDNKQGACRKELKRAVFAPVGKAAFG